MTLTEVVRRAKANNACLVNLWADDIQGRRYIGTWTVEPRTLTNFGQPFGKVVARLRRSREYRHTDFQSLAFTVARHRSDWVLISKARTLDLMTAGGGR